MLAQELVGHEAVSIHARHCWRARRSASPFRRPLTLFQSTPAIAGERDHSAHLRPGAPPMFQSTPAIAGERDSGHRPTGWRGRCFNPRPPLLPSETSRSGLYPWPNPSFNPRPPLLASETSFKPISNFHFMFQSTPAIAGERDLLQRVQAQQAGLVSIHARHCWRARPPVPRCCWRSASFNPRPPLLASETSGPLSWSTWTACFNPRPPLLVSETFVTLGFDHSPEVSIHARHCWRARLVSSRAPGKVGEVSIHARHCWRARPGLARCTTRPRPCFNPRPPLLASETSGSVREVDQGCVSIHARHCWRARRDRLVGCSIILTVSIHARHCWRARP